MANPKRIDCINGKFYTPEEAIAGSQSAGITIIYIKSRKTLYISGWYDDCAGIEGGEIPLTDFLEKLGIK